MASSSRQRARDPTPPAPKTRQTGRTSGGVRPSPSAGDARLGRGEGPFRRPGATAPGPQVDYDVIVVGAGPAGSETSRRLAAAGRTVLLLEEHRRVGTPVQCAGLIATNVFPLIGLDPHGDFHQQEIWGGHIVSPSGERLLLRSPEVHAHAVSRGAFDRALAERSIAAGAELARGVTYLDTKQVGSTKDTTHTIQVRVDDGTTDPYLSRLTCRLLVGADGVGSEVARTNGFTQPQFVLSGLEIELEGIDIPDPENVHVHTGSDIAPGYFAWIVPKGPHGARVGLALDVHRAKGRSALEYYHAYVTKRPDVAQLVEGGHEVDRIVGCIPLGLRDRLVGDGVALVGDAGGFAKPTSGGGIYMASWGALHLAKAADAALARGRSDARALGAYERRVRRTIGRELAVGAAMHRVFRAMPDDELDRLTRRLSDPRIVKTLNRHGDIDHPSRLVLPVLARQPGLLGHAGPALRELVLGALRVH